MPTDFDVLALVLCALVVFGAGWTARGIADATMGMLKAGADYFRERANG